MKWRQSNPQEKCPNCKLKMYCQKHPLKPPDVRSAQLKPPEPETLNRLYNDIVASRLMRYHGSDNSDSANKPVGYWQKELEKK